MMLWNFLLVFHIVYADVIREDGYHNYEGQFTVKNKGRMLRVLMSFRSVPLEECALNCVRHLRCRTFNYNIGKKDCELTDEDFDEMNGDTITHGWYNYGTPERVNGGWSSWRNFTICSKKCGGGTLEQYRDCDSPKPDHGGNDCKGRMRRRVKCNTHGCQVVNVALRKAATQSSSYHNLFPSSYAVDGDTSTSVYTENEPNPWFMVDLGEIRVIKEIILNLGVHYSINRGLLVETLRNKGNDWILCKNLGDVKERINEFNCNEKSTKAQFLKIRSTKFCRLQIYEVDVSGY